MRGRSGDHYSGSAVGASGGDVQGAESSVEDLVSRFGATENAVAAVKTAEGYANSTQHLQAATWAAIAQAWATIALQETLEGRDRDD